MRYAKFNWNWLSGSGKRDFKIDNIYLLSPLGKGKGPSFKNKFEYSLLGDFGWNLPGFSGKEYFQKFCYYHTLNDHMSL